MEESEMCITKPKQLVCDSNYVMLCRVTEVRKKHLCFPGICHGEGTEGRDEQMGAQGIF